MSIDLKHFAGASVTPADDARLYNFLLSGKTGIVEGVEITHLGANQLKISSGWGVCCGRVFTVSEETVNAAVSASGEVKGRLLINIDVSADVPATFVTQAAADLPQLVQEDINSSGTVYQLPLAEYTVDALACSNVTDARVLLELTEKAIQRAQTTADTAKTNAATAQTTADTAKTNAAEAQTTANAAMPKSGGTFTGDAVAYSTNRTTSSLRNTEVRVTSTTGTLQSTNKIIMVRK